MKFFCEGFHVAYENSCACMRFVLTVAGKASAMIKIIRRRNLFNEAQWTQESKQLHRNEIEAANFSRGSSRDESLRAEMSS
jgi:hypothetical protein